jgi:hypothetical protein
MPKKTKEELLKELAALEEEEKTKVNPLANDIAQAIKMAMYGVNGLPNIPPPVPPTKPTEQNNNPDMITKRIAAIEVYRELITVEMMAMAGIIAPTLVVFLTIFNKYAGLAGSVGVTIYYMIQLFKARKTMNVLDQKYQIKQYAK